MGTEPEDLRRDIERRRDDLGDTIDAIGDRVSPGRILERRRNRMSDGLSSLKERVMGPLSSGTSAVGDAAGSVRDHANPQAVKEQTAGSPLLVGALAFGVGFLVAAVLPSTDTEQDAAQRAQGALEPAKDAVVDAARNVAADVKEGAAEAAQDVKATATDAAGTVKSSAQDQAAATKDDASSVTS